VALWVQYQQLGTPPGNVFHVRKSFATLPTELEELRSWIGAPDADQRLARSIVGAVGEVAPSPPANYIVFAPLAEADLHDSPSLWLSRDWLTLTITRKRHVRRPEFGDPDPLTSPRGVHMIRSGWGNLEVVRSTGDPADPPLSVSLVSEALGGIVVAIWLT